MMRAHSSTSSSDSLHPDAAKLEPPCQASPCGCKRIGSYRPTAALTAVALAVVFHLAAAYLYREPVARVDLREKVRALTNDRRPSILAAGDSRFECGVIPDVLAGELKVAKDKVVNIAEAGCDLPAVLAAFSEFAPRFESTPTLILNLSFFGANDGAVQVLGDETLWTLTFAERARLAGVTRAFATCFLPEKAAWQSLARFWPGTIISPDESGFESAPASACLKNWSAEYRQKRAEALRKWWYSNINLQGTRWRRLSEDLEQLANSQALTIVVLMPEHPAFADAFNGTAAGEANLRFRQNVRNKCEDLGIVCLDYEPDCLQPNDPDLLFHDLIHLNRAGAAAFTAVLARDVLQISSKRRVAQKLAGRY